MKHIFFFIEMVEVILMVGCYGVDAETAQLELVCENLFQKRA